MFFSEKIKFKFQNINLTVQPDEIARISSISRWTSCLRSRSTEITCESSSEMAVVSVGALVLLADTDTDADALADGDFSFALSIGLSFARSNECDRASTLSVSVDGFAIVTSFDNTKKNNCHCASVVEFFIILKK